MKKKGVPKGPFYKFVAVDMAVIAAALALSFFIRFGEISPNHIEPYLIFALPILLVRIGSLYLFRMYDYSRVLTTFDIIYFTGCAMLIAHALENLILLYWGKFGIESEAITDDSFGQISRYILFLNFILSWTGAAFWRVLYLKRRQRWAYDRTRILIVGAGELGESVKREIQEYSRLGHEVVGLIDDDIEQRGNGAPILGRMADLDRLVKKHEIDEIIVTSRQANRQELLDIISSCRITGCIVRLLPDLYEVTIGQVEIGQVAGVPLITLTPSHLSGWGILGKRCFDIAASLLFLFLLTPIFPFIAAAILLGSKGPVFFRQRRIGIGGSEFIVYKFRTMYENAELETGPVLSWDEDPRVTPVGRFLRRMHLDETPQFINVLKGEMSVVGPRPERPHFVEQYIKEIPAYRMREAVRPGVTGLAQIHGFYNSPVEHKLRYDLAYIHNMSLLLDLKIIFNTLRVTFSGHGETAK